MSIQLVFSRPGTPTDNAHIESFNGSLREECLNTNWFMSLEDAKEKLEIWRNDNNEYRPHSALSTLPPAEFARNHAAYGHERLGFFTVKLRYVDRIIWY
jgi:putative transposase